ncbi:MULTISPECIES: CS1-pili formation C-terminal domain-containing protein [Vibrio]|uniref:Pilus assembly protein E-set like domain-containing protein n=3 Tax=Vibrio TaxID=662 RepID=A0A7Z1MJC4_9VIBR|nr:MULTISPECIES: CS1-pili formation C-terminal domain-containing protein [Vibrio]PMK78418.1 hypothetical protein BCT92_20470 [Vibrio sp. 10N.261.52.E5]PMP25111.1 hypothetical protein BCS91_12715 [Vibrio cyclitrophicus]PMP29938.1 hypothetical protein BCS90_00560 [Vibrio cyclitrophicus]TKF79308.1 hypothetical protein FCV65_22170 [Vibrio sp. F13]
MLFRLVKIKAMIAICLLPALVEASSLKNNIPSGFDEFFRNSINEIKLRNLDGSFTDPILLVSNYQTVKLTTVESHSKIRDFLNDNRIDAKYVDEIIQALSDGVSNQSSCRGYITECVLYPEIFEFVFNNRDKELYLFVHPKVLDLGKGPDSISYHSAYSEHSGIVNNVNMYFSSYLDQDTSVSINDQLVAGLPYGYITSNVGTNVGFGNSNKENDLTLYDISYNLDWDDKLIKTGYFQYLPKVNSTDFLSGSSSIMPQTSFFLGSSKNMIVGGSNANKQFNFYSAQSGDVELIRDGRIIYQGNVEQGQNSISYNELPSGRYEVELVLRTGGAPVNQGVYFIFNSIEDSLTQGQFDYLISAGKTSSGNGISTIEYENGQEIESKAFVQGRLSYQLLPRLLIGLGTKVIEDEAAFEVGMQYSLGSFDADIVLNSHVFSDGHFLNTTFSSNWGSLNYEKMNSEGGYLSTYLYNSSSYEKLFWSSNYRFDNGSSLYAVYTLSKDENLEQGERIYDDVLLGYRFGSFSRSSFDITVQTDSDFEEGSFSIMWTLPLSDTVDLISSVMGDKSSANRFSNTLNKADLLESDLINSSLNISNLYDRRQGTVSQTGMITANGIGDKAHFGGSLYANSDGTIGATGTISSTQIFSDELYISSKSASSYLALDIKEKNKNLIDKEVNGFVTVNQDGRNLVKKSTTDSLNIIPLSSYSQYRVNFDAESVGLNNTGDKNAMFFSTPGKVLKFVPQVHKTVSFISGFNNINNNFVSNVECLGDGCISVVQLIDGVYRVTVLEGFDFRLVSDGNECFIPRNEHNVYMNFGKNYCLPTDTDGVFAVNVDGRGYEAIYVGLFTNAELEQSGIIKQLENYSYHIITKPVGQLNAVYIANNRVKMTDLLVNHIDSVEKLKENAKRKYINNIFFPVAKQ